MGFLIFAIGGPAPALPLDAVTVLLQSAALPVCLAIAILRYRRFDVDIINRALVYSSISAIFAEVFASISVVVQHIVLALTGKESQINAVVAAVVVTALFQPVRRWAHSLVDHYLHPAR